MRSRSPSSSADPGRRPGIGLGALSLGAALVCAVACDGGGGSPDPGPPAAVILSQPEDQTVFEGQSALFQIHAMGTGGVTYQWRLAGVPIPGATDSHLVAGPTAPGDDGATYSVSVTNAGAAPVESRAARLTVDPPLDLRFQWVGASYRPTYVGGSNLLAPYAARAGGTGSPLLVGSGICGGDVPLNCSWIFFLDPAVPGMTITYEAGALSWLPASWAETLSPDTVVTSLDFEEASGAYAVALSRTTQAGEFTPVVQGSVPLDQLQAAASSEGAAGRVLTAVSFRGGLVSYVSYGWSRAAATVYEARVVSSSFDAVADDAATLAGEGYAITAFGAGNEAANGLVLVGTRVQGNTAARPLTVAIPTTPIPSVPGYAIVGYFFDAGTSTFRVIAEQ